MSWVVSNKQHHYLLLISKQLLQLKKTLVKLQLNQNLRVCLD